MPQPERATRAFAALVDDLAQEEHSHENRAEELTEKAIAKGAGRREKEAQQKLFLSRWCNRDWQD